MSGWIPILVVFLLLVQYSLSVMSTRQHIAYYITGHGYGHATRCVELMRGLLASGKYKLTAVSSLDENFFYRELSSLLGYDVHTSGSFTVRTKTLDTGGVQVDAIVLDPLRTLETYHNKIGVLHDKLETEEACWLSDEGVNLVLVDATPLACAAARKARIKSVLVTNLTWDFIFKDMLNVLLCNPSLTKGIHKSLLDVYAATIERCIDDVSSCTHMIQYPGENPLLIRPPLPSTNVIQAPMLCRPVRNRNLRNELGLAEDTKILLLGFGGHSAEAQFGQITDSALPEGWHCLVLRADPAILPSSRFTALPNDSYVPDLIYASDVVLGKIGYGFVSECLSAGTPLVYVPRVYWAEEQYLESLLNRFQAGVSLPLDEFKVGNWGKYINEAYKRRRKWTLGELYAPSEGATTVVMHHIEAILNSNFVDSRF